MLNEMQLIELDLNRGKCATLFKGLVVYVSTRKEFEETALP